MTKTKLAALVCLFFTLTGHAQTVEETHKAQVESLVNFYQYMLNTVGGERTSTRDKEVIITESFRKIFRDGQVQIEDDLLPGRTAISNKDVSAYLRDVDFFFKNITFTFTEIDIQKQSGDQGTFYLVSMISNIDAVTLEGAPFKTSGKRFIEINLDESRDDLKIVSVYSTKVSRERELQNWWASLSYEWTRVFQQAVGTTGEITSDELLRMAAIDSLNLSGNRYLQDLAPLSALTNLRVLDISDTRIEDLEPIRFSRRLRVLRAANTSLASLTLLQYFDQLTELDISQTEVWDLAGLEQANGLTVLRMKNVRSADFSPLQQLTELAVLDLSGTSFSQVSVLRVCRKLTELNLSGTGIRTVEGLQMLPLKRLNLSDTYISSLAPLANHRSLEEILINRTAVADLMILAGAPNLRRIEADNAGVSAQEASKLMAANRQILVLTNTQKVMEWWTALPEEWQRVLSQKIGGAATRESLTRLLQADSLQLSGHRLLSGEPLGRFTRLRYLDVSGNLFTNLDFATHMEWLEVFKASQVPVDNARPLIDCRNLQEVHLNNTLIQSVDPFLGLNKLRLLDVENTPVPATNAVQLEAQQPGLMVIYRTRALQEWFDELPGTWRELLNLPAQPDAQTLHQITSSREVRISGRSITGLLALAPFTHLHTLEISNAALMDLTDLAVHTRLEKIVCTNSPLADVQALAGLYQLKHLDISNTAVKDLRPLRTVVSLEVLNCSGTAVKTLKGLETLENLKSLNISNTGVWQLDRLYDIRDLKELICYNTRLKSPKIEAFQSVFPHCQVTFY